MHPNPAFRAKIDPGVTGQTDSTGLLRNGSLLRNDGQLRNEDQADGIGRLYASLIDQIGFGMVFLTTPNGPRVAHTPLVVRAGGRIAFHLARGNALTRHMDNATALIVLNGPDGYVSARWYDDADQVPTWNYVALECEGVVRQMDHDGLIDLLASASARHEARLDGAPWTMDKVSPPVMARLTDAIVGFEMDVLAWRPTLKLSQNKRPEERERVIAGLEATGATAIAATMRALAKPA